jgi:hypothetical protein
MGQEELQFNDEDDENYKRGLLTRNFFDFQYVIGKGGFGKVSLIEIKVFIYFELRYGKYAIKRQEKYMQ